MGILPVALWTDMLIWLLLSAITVFVWYCSRHAHLAAPWARVFRSRAALASAVFLAAYLMIGLCDSLHYRQALPTVDTRSPVAYAVEVRSLLDAALSALRERNERTYSAPLATRLHQKELIEKPDGSSSRDYPRLRHGGAHLANEDAWGEDIAWHLFAGLVASIALWGLLVAAMRYSFARRWPEIPWGAAYAALACMLALAGPLAALAVNYHVLGTDKIGQDVLYQALKSIRTSMVIGTLTTLVLLPVGIAAGIMAGYFRGWVDDAIQYFYTTLNSIPGVLLIAASVLMVQVFVDSHPDLFPTAAQRADFRLLMLCAILGAIGWTGLARLLRGETLKLVELEYIQAAHAFGVPDARILLRHILPNVSHIVIIALVMDFSGLVLAEAVLSYVGVGVDPTTISFGTMINAARLEMAREPMVWWALATAFTFMFVLVLAANLFADAVRDGFDPRVRM
ncbi:MAG: ABC transporter permease [Betaproteobacteria bacterium]|nr:ABC transporter permease [Betaproteobacteria bacterium]